MTTSKSFAEDEISAIVTKKLLQKDHQVLNWNLQPTRTKTRLLGDHMILSVEVISEEKVQKLIFFVKFLPDNEDQLMFVNATRAFDREIFLYENLFEKCECVPRFYLSKERHVIVLEDLTELGFVEVERTKTLDFATISLILKTLAEFHAISLVYEETKSKQLNKTYSLIDEFSDQLEERIYVQRENFIPTTSLTAAITGVLKIVHYFDLGEKVVENVKKVCENIIKLARPSTRFRNVICHGGLWATNLLIKDQSACKFINFQLSRYTPPAQDFLSLLHLTTSRDFRAKNLDQVINIYYDSLKTQLSKADFDLNAIISLTDFIQSCEEHRCFAIVQAIIHLQFAALGDRAMDALFQDGDYAQKAFYEDSSVVFFRNVDQDPVYKLRLTEAFQDLKDYCDLLL